MIQLCPRTLRCGAFTAILAMPAQAVVTDLIPLQKGYVVATCHSNTSTWAYTQDPNGFVVAVLDGTDHTSAPTGLPGSAFAWKFHHNEQAIQNPGAPDPLEEWTAGNLGEVFGITIDDASNPNIYVAATTAYGVYATPAGNSHGTVYKLDGTTGDITPFNCIPAGNPSLGQLAHASGHLYVTNLDDGLVYQLDLAGNCLGTYDHGVSGRPNETLSVLPDDGSAGPTQLDRRVWGIGANQGRLYYGVWNTGNTHTVWSVALGGGGAPNPSTAQIEIASVPGSMPVSDITFASDGRMFTAQRYHKGIAYGGPHQGDVLEHVPSGTSWTTSPTNKFKTGGGSGRNSAGGVGLECTGGVWASADAIVIDWTTPLQIYGLQRIAPSGNQADSPNIVNTHIVDLDGVINVQPKTYIGDVDVYDPCDDCFDLSEIKIECPTKNGDPYLVTFKITNRSDQTAHYIWHTPCDPADIPQGGLGGQPDPVGPQPLPTPIKKDECATVTVQLPAPNTGGKFYWNITLLDETGGECCTDKACIELPDCDCFIVLDKSVDCTVGADGLPKYTLSIKIQNTSTFPWYHVNLLPPAFFSPATFDLSGSPVAPGAIYTVNTCVNGSGGDIVCFNISVHSEDINECCAKECCIVLPPCDMHKPDHCNVTRVAPCCPEFPGGPHFAHVALTICNNSSAARTYNWNMMAMPANPANGCPDTLPLGNAAFTPPNGNVVVGPNSCVNINIAVNCEGLQPGARACYQACVQDTANPANRFCCDGRIYVPAQPGPVIKDDPAGGNPDGTAILVPGANTRHTIQVENPSDQLVRFAFEMRSLGDAVEIASPSATTPEFQSTKRVFLDLAPFETEIVSMDLRAGVTLPFENVVIPILVYPLTPTGEVTDNVFSFPAIAPVQQGVPPALKGIARNQDGTFTMTLLVNPGRTYRIESSQSLGSIDPWAPVTCSTVENGHAGTEFTATGGILQLIVTPDPACPDNFFRAVELP